MNKAERFSEMARRWFEREDTGLTVDRFLRAIGKRATEEAAHIIQSEGPPRIGFMAWLVPFSDGSHAAMFMRDGAVPIIADICCLARWTDIRPMTSILSHPAKQSLESICEYILETSEYGFLNSR